MAIRTLFFLLVSTSLFYFSSCKGDEPVEEIQAEISSFSLIDQESVEYILNIDQENLAISNDEALPNTVEITGMVAKFKTTGENVTLQVDGKVQVSGTTVNDFSKPVVYDVYVSGKKQRSYSVVVKKPEQPTNDFSAFYFTEPEMSRYTVTINTNTCEISNRTAIPYVINLTALKPFFSTFEEDAVVTVNGVLQESGVTANDFTGPVKYRIRGRDGSEKEYTVNLKRELSAYFNNPVYRGDVPDPTVIRVGDEFYMYGTGGTTTVYKSKNMVIWEYVGLAFNSEDRPSFLEGGSMWAPDINYFDGKYVLYYAMAKWGASAWDCGIGVAVSDSPEGPFKLTNSNGKMFISSEIGVKNSIDPCIIEDQGKKYMFWGSFNSIYATELTTNGLQVKDMAVKTKVAGNAYEGVYVHKRGNYFYLFASIGSCCVGDNSTYTMVVGRSSNVLGPYVNKAGREMVYDNHEVLVRGDDMFAGPGHNSRIITDDAGQDWILYHAYLRGESEKGRMVILDQVKWDDEGWPVISNGYPTRTSDIAPDFNAQ